MKALLLIDTNLNGVELSGVRFGDAGRQGLHDGVVVGTEEWHRNSRLSLDIVRSVDGGLHEAVRPHA